VGTTGFEYYASSSVSFGLGPSDFGFAWQFWDGFGLEDLIYDFLVAFLRQG
jgi:hypothetical protein